MRSDQGLQESWRLKVEETIRRLNADFGFELSDEEIKIVALQAEAMNRSLKPLFDVDVTQAMPMVKLDRRTDK
jgi:hypothetical protein